MRLALAVLALASLTACSGSAADPKALATEASAALSKGDYATAQAKAEQGLTAPGAAADKATAWTLERIRLEALAGKGEVTAVLTGLTKLAGDYATQVNADLYAKLGKLVADAGKLAEAIDLVEAGKQAFPDKVAAFDGLVASIKEAASAGGDSAAVEKLKALGYL